MSKNNKIVNRVEFIEWRYKRFLEKKLKLELIYPRDSYILTDLDRDYGDGIMKNIILCDSCNKNILDPSFIMLENNLVYHFQCIGSKDLINVVPLIKKVTRILSMVFLIFLATSCGKAKTDSTRAESIPAPMSGYKCFIIYDGDGKAVGGNCVKE